MNYLQWALNLSSPEILMWVSTQGSVFKQSIYELNEEIFDMRSWGQSISSICDHFIAFRYSPGRRGDDTTYGEIGQNFEFSCWNIWQPTSRWQFGIQLVHQITACEAPVTLHIRLIHLALWNYIFTISGLAAILSHSHTVYCNIFWWICIAYSLPTGYIHIYLLTRTVLMTVRIFNCPPQSLIRTRVVWRRARRSAVIITGFSWLTVWQTDSNQPCQSVEDLQYHSTPSMSNVNPQSSLNQTRSWMRKKCPLKFIFPMNILETEQNNVRAITPHGKWPTRIPHTSYTTTSNLLHIPPHNWKYM